MDEIKCVHIGSNDSLIKYWIIPYYIRLNIELGKNLSVWWINLWIIQKQNGMTDINNNILI